MGVVVATLASRALHALQLTQTVGEALAEIGHKGYRHQGYPILLDGKLVGVVTSRELIAADAATPLAELVTREPVTVHGNETARAAVTRMADEEVGRLVMVIDGESNGPGVADPETTSHHIGEPRWAMAIAVIAAEVLHATLPRSVEKVCSSSCCIQAARSSQLHCVQ